MRRPGRRRPAVRGAAALVCAVLALGGAAAGPGSAAAAPAEALDGVPAYEPAEDARKVDGAVSSGESPDIEPGVYSDTIGPGEKKYYGLTLDAESSAFLSAVAAPKPGSQVQTVGEGLQLKLAPPDGPPCDGSNDPDFAGDGAAYPIADYATRIAGADDGCQKSGPYLFSVERKGGSGSAARWPLEIRFMTEPGLKGSPPSAPADNGAGDEPPAPASGGEKKSAHGGTGFNDAGAVSDGVWRDRIRPGETRFYRVPVDWGQRLSAAVELSTAANPGKFPQTVFNGLGLTTYNPARGRFDDEDFVSYSPDQPAQAVSYTPVVHYGNRFADDGEDASVAGWHYLAVTVSPKVAESFPKSAPLTLRIDVEGEAKPGPEYEGDAAAAGFGVSDEDREQAERAQTAAQARRSATLETVGYAGVGTGTALIAALGLWTLLARRRAASAAGGADRPPAGGGGPGTAPPWPQQQGGPGWQNAHGGPQPKGRPGNGK